jgi:hypothetical protein
LPLIHDSYPGLLQKIFIHCCVSISILSFAIFYAARFPSLEQGINFTWSDRKKFCRNRQPPESKISFTDRSLHDFDRSSDRTFFEICITQISNPIVAKFIRIGSRFLRRYHRINSFVQCISSYIMIIIQHTDRNINKKLIL